jgi:hypothetical protein
MSIPHLAATGFPFGRKARFVTSTVLPTLVYADNFAHFGRLTELVGFGRSEVDPRPATAKIQFFIKYGFVESTFCEVKAWSPDASTRNDRPDWLVYIACLVRSLIAIEAKMSNRPAYDRRHDARDRGAPRGPRSSSRTDRRTPPPCGVMWPSRTAAPRPDLEPGSCPSSTLDVPIFRAGDARTTRAEGSSSVRRAIFRDIT